MILFYQNVYLNVKKSVENLSMCFFFIFIILKNIIYYLKKYFYYLKKYNKAYHFSLIKTFHLYIINSE